MRILLAVIILSFSILTIFLGLSADKILFTDDIGLSFTVASRIFALDFPLLGQPSHLSGRHLGPIYYYYLALIQLLSLGSAQVAVLLLTLAKLISLGGLAVIAKQLANIKYAKSLIAIALITISYQYLFVFRAPWVNNYFLIPAIFFYYSLYRALRFGWKEAPLFFLASSFVVQSFLGAAPAIVAISLIVLITTLFFREKAEQCQKKSRLFIYLLIILVWLPPVIWELSYPSNILGIFFQHSNHRAEADWLAIFSFIAKYFQESLINLRYDSLFKLSFFKSTFFILLIYHFFLALRKNKLLQKFFLCVFVGLFATAYSLKLIQPPYHGFYLNFFLPIPILILIIIYNQLSLATLNKEKNLLLKLPASILLIALLYNYYCNFQNDWQLNHKIVDKEQSLLHMQEVSRVVKNNLPQKHTEFLFKAAGQYRHKKSAIYYLAEMPNYSFNTYAKTFKELDGFKPNKSRVDKLGFNLVCESARFKDLHIKKLKNLQKKWNQVKEVALKSCSTCDGCYLYKSEL